MSFLPTQREAVIDQRRNAIITGATHCGFRRARALLAPVKTDNTNSQQDPVEGKNNFVLR